MAIPLDGAASNVGIRVQLAVPRVNAGKTPVPSIAVIPERAGGEIPKLVVTTLPLRSVTWRLAATVCSTFVSSLLISRVALNASRVRTPFWSRRMLTLAQTEVPEANGVGRPMIFGGPALHSK